MRKNCGFFQNSLFELSPLRLGLLRCLSTGPRSGQNKKLEKELDGHSLLLRPPPLCFFGNIIFHRLRRMFLHLVRDGKQSYCLRRKQDASEKLQTPSGVYRNNYKRDD